MLPTRTPIFPPERGVRDFEVATGAGPAPRPVRPDPSGMPALPKTGGSSPPEPLVLGVLLSLVVHVLIASALLAFAGITPRLCEFPTTILAMDLSGMGEVGGGEGAPGEGCEQPEASGAAADATSPAEVSREPGPVTGEESLAVRNEVPVSPDIPPQDTKKPEETEPRQAVAPSVAPVSPPPPRRHTASESRVRKRRPTPPPPDDQRKDAPPASAAQVAERQGTGQGSQEAGSGRGSAAAPGPDGQAGNGGARGQTGRDHGQGDFPEGQFGRGEGPRFARLASPRYPAQAKEKKQEGGVLLRLTIDEHGALRRVEIVKSGGAEFDEEAVKAVKASSYVAATMHGKHVACRALLYVHFNLSLRGQGNGVHAP